MFSSDSASWLPRSVQQNKDDDGNYHDIDGLFQNSVMSNVLIDALNHRNPKEGAPPRPDGKDLPDPNQTEKLLVKEMNALSVNEREEIYENIHGVSKKFEEKPEFVAQRMEEMDKALQKIREKNAYNMAMAQSSSFVHSLYLRFLRSTNFDPKRAASKLVLSLEIKLELFGPELVGKHIEYYDLNALDKQCIQSGWHQVLPFRDRAGRTIIWMNHKARRKDLPSINNARANYYISTCIANDEETQKCGVVGVSFPICDGDFSPEARDFVFRLSRNSAACPLRPEGHHICLESKLMTPFLYMCISAFGKHLRLHTRIHQGPYTENAYTLMSFGIPVAYAPVTSGGKVKLKFFRQWLSRQLKLEQQMCKANRTPTMGIELPFRDDILIGSGVPVQSYSGNVQFRAVVEKYREQFARCENRDKSRFVRQIYDLLHSDEYSVRFLIRSSADDWWSVAPREVVLKKIAHRLRAKPLGTSSSSSASTSRRRMKASTGTQSNDDSLNNTANMFLGQSDGFETTSLLKCCQVDSNPVKRMKFT